MPFSSLHTIILAMKDMIVLESSSLASILSSNSWSCGWPPTASFACLSASWLDNMSVPSWIDSAHMETKIVMEPEDLFPDVGI